MPGAPRNLQARKSGENHRLSWFAPADTGQHTFTYVVKVCKRAAEHDVCVLADRTTNTNARP